MLCHAQSRGKEEVNQQHAEEEGRDQFSSTTQFSISSSASYIFHHTADREEDTVQCMQQSRLEQ